MDFSSQVSTSLYTTSDSPVNEDSLIESWWTSSNLISAGTLSPSSNQTISPGTTSSIDNRCSIPSRNTIQWHTSNFLRESIAFSAFASCIYDNTAFNVKAMQIKIGVPRSSLSAMNAIIAANNNKYTIGSLK